MRFLELLLLFAVLSAGCRNLPEPRTMPSASGRDPHFPQLAPAKGERGYPQALLEGTLTRIADCLRVTSAQGGVSYLIVWPPQVTLERAGGNTRVVDTASGTAGQEGDVVRLAGGEIQPSAPVLEELREPLPEGCPGPVWLASGLVAPSRVE